MIEPRPKWGRSGIWAVQVLGVLGTSYLLERALPWLPGWSSSRIPAQLAEAARADPAQRIAEFLRDAVLTGTLEELFFRGLVFELVRRARGPRAAIVTSAVLFGLAHGDWHQAVAAGLLGLQLGAIRLFHGLALAVIAHVVSSAPAVGPHALARALALDRRLRIARAARMQRAPGRGPIHGPPSEDDAIGRMTESRPWRAKASGRTSHGDRHGGRFLFLASRHPARRRR
jgi:hypothetical protein